MTTATAEVRSFEASSVADALRKTARAGYKPLTAPELAEERIKDTDNSGLWRNWHNTLSGVYIGKTKQGTGVVAVTHVNHYLTNPDNIEAAIRHGLVRGAAATPGVAEDFERLLEMKDDETVFIIDYADWGRAESGRISLTEALKHPLTVPILGSRERAEHYIEAHSKVFKTQQIGIWKTNELSDQPVARLLEFGDNFGNDLYAYYSLGDLGRFSGVRAEGAALRSPLEELIGKGTDVGNDLVVVRRDQVSDEVYKLLVGEQ